MKIIELNNEKYEIIDNYKNSLNYDELCSLCTEHFLMYDYILGDYSYSKLRLKGFFHQNNKKKSDYNNILNYKSYILDYCATDCGYFLLKKENNVEKTK